MFFLKKFAPVFFFIFVLTIGTSAQSTQSPAAKNRRHASATNEPDVAVWKLPNGLEVVHLRKPSSKVLVSVVTVDVGSKDEDAATSGLSHLLEHMVFDGTTRRTRAQINEGSKRYGGYVNATTQAGFTSYLSIFPAAFAELSLDLQADMLFNSTLPPQELEKERKVVIEEMKRDRDSASTRAEEFNDEQLFAGTSFARPVLGFETTIASVPRQTVLRYYHSHYVPQRMKAMITSPFPAAQVRRWMEKTFGTAKAAPAAAPVSERWRFSPSDVPRYKEDAVPSAYLHIAFAAPSLSDPDFYAYDLLTQFLAGDRTSPLDRAMRSGHPPLADNLSSELQTEKDFCVWKLSLVTQPGQIPDILETLRRALESTAAMGVPVQEITRLQRQVLSQEAILSEQAMYYGLMKAPLLNARGYSFMASYPARLRRVSSEDLLRVAEKYFSKPAFFATALVPKGKIPAAENPADAHAWQREVLPNGLTVIAKGSDESDVFAMAMLTRQRTALEPPDEGGISDFVQRLLLKGTTSRNEESIQKELDNLSAQIQLVDNPFIPYDDAWTTNRFNFFRLEVLDELRGHALDLMGDVVAHASFPEPQVAKVRDEILRLQQREADNAAKRAQQRLHERLLAGTPYAQPILGTPASIQNISRDDLLAHFQRQYAPSNVVIIAAGKGTTAGVMRDMKSRFEELKGSAVKVETTAPAPPTTFKFEKIPSTKQQIQIAAGTLTAGWSSADSAALRVLNSILSERLAVELREKQGLAYSVGSDLQQEKGYGWIEVRMGTRAETAEQARQGILSVIHNLAAGNISADERERAVNGLWGRLLRQRLSRIGQAFYRGVDEVRGPGYDAEDSAARGLPALQAVTLDDLKRVAREALNTDHWLMVSVGKN